MLKKHTSIIGITCAALNMLVWALLAVFQPSAAGYNVLPLLASAFALLGSLFLYKKPSRGAAVLLVTGLLISVYEFVLWLYYFAGWPQMIPSLLLIAAGVFAFVSARKAPVSNKPQD